MSIEEEKAVLFPAVERFNEFKKLLGSTISPESIHKTEDTSQHDSAPAAPAGSIMPAFADLPENEVKGFQADEEAAALGIANPDNVNSHVSEFFGEDDTIAGSSPDADEAVTEEQVSERLEAQFDETLAVPADEVSENIALQGVDVEEGDEVDEDDTAPESLVAAVPDDLPVSPVAEAESLAPAAEDDDEEQLAEQLAQRLESQFDETSLQDEGGLAGEIALQGVDVEMGDADEEDEPSEEAVIAFAEDDFTESPAALSSAGESQVEVGEEQVAEQITEKLATQFDESVEVPVGQISPEVALQGVNVEEDDDEDEEEGLGEDQILTLGEDELPAAPATVTGLETESPVAAPSVDSEDAGVTFPAEYDDAGPDGFEHLDKEVALQGVDVESEADDDSDEEALPLMEGELAPALADNDEVSVYNAARLEDVKEPEGLEDEIADTVLDFFGDDDEQETAPFIEPVADDTAVASDEVSGGVPAADSLPAEETLSFEEPEISVDADDTKAIAESDDVAADIENKLDNFFGDDDSPKPEEQAQEKSGLAAAVAGAAGVAAAAVTSAVHGGEVEDEVIFELVEEEEPFEEDAGQRSELSGMKKVPSDTAHVPQGLENLADCIDAVEVELEDKVMTALMQEIDSATSRFMNAPLEKTFLQLLKTVASHIDTYRYESGSDAYALLKSVFEAMSLGLLTGEQKQELLLAQTTRVLDWQQEIIVGQAEKKKDSSALSEPLFVQDVDDKNDEDMITFDDGVLTDMDATAAEASESDIKDEVSSLKQSLQDDINSHKKES